MQLRELLFLLMFSLAVSVSGQYLGLSDGKNITNMSGNQICPEWSPDSRQVLFLSENNGTSMIYIYRTDNDTITCLGDSLSKYHNPVWYPDGNAIIFDSEMSGSEYLYKLDLETNKVRPLFNRNIRCKDASFSNSSRQVYFTGFDELTNRWELYSYDFVYDNLNKLTNHKSGISNCNVSGNGKHVVYCKNDPFSGSANLEIINWYGEKLMSFSDYDVKDVSWGPSDFKLFFVSEMRTGNYELYSVWKDGKRLERITEIAADIANPVVSPDGTMLALSVKSDNGWDIYIFPFDDY